MTKKPDAIARENVPVGHESIAKQPDNPFPLEKKPSNTTLEFTFQIA
jgi:hypothetical protein